MSDSLFKKLYSQQNLELAWKRLLTAQDLSYKSYYRELFNAYELSKSENLEALSSRIKNGSYTASKPLRFFLPKSSGLQRTISILSLDDMIVYQAMANVLVAQFSKKRVLVENQTVFSNILNLDPNDEIFFLKRWQESYRNFIKKIKDYYKKGNKWVAHFDLAAYYDTISQDSLKHLISPRSQTSFKDLLGECLKTWSSSPKSRWMKQGIPQGPQASSFFCEIYLLDIDLELEKEKVKYVRYVDDIKIFGTSKEEVLKGVILLDRVCKEKGLIPQGKKYEILEIKKVADAIGKSPSLTLDEKRIIPKSEEEAFQIFKKAFYSSSMDSSKVKYILKVSEKNSKIRRIVLGNLHRHPELVDYFTVFLAKYSSEYKLGEYLFKTALKRPSPYEYVEGKYWELLSKFRLQENIKKEAVSLAINRLTKNKENYALKLGTYKMIASQSTNLLMRFLPNEDSSFIQGLVVPSISSTVFEKKEYMNLIKHFLKRSNYEPALLCISQLYFNLKLSVLNSIPFSKKDDSHVINNTLGKKEKIDSIGQILKNRFRISNFNKWETLLQTDYANANKQLILAVKSWYEDPDAWIGCVDAFNDLLFRKLVEMLTTKGIGTPWPSIIDIKGKIVHYGTILENCNKKNKVPLIVSPFLAFHKRRNRVPTSHPKDLRTGKPTESLTIVEQKRHRENLSKAYEEIITIMKAIC